MEAIIFIGIPASGKSTFFRDKFSNTHIRVNRDMLKTKHRVERLFAVCLEIKQDFVIDNTNVTKSERVKYIERSKDYGFRVIGYYFKSSINDAIAKNSSRKGGERIDERGVLSRYNQLELPSLDEGFDELYYVSQDNAGSFIVEEWKSEV